MGQRGYRPEIITAGLRRRSPVLRHRLARLLIGPPPPRPRPRPPAPQPPPVAETAWPDVCERFALRMLLLAEELRPALDRLEADEDDPDRLERLYQVDHAVTRIRRAARELRVLAGRYEPGPAGRPASLMDVIRVAESAIERYRQVALGTVADLAVAAHAADDVAALLAVLLDNATRYSPSRVTISGHLLQDGGVMLRIEDSGIGIEPGRLAAINELLAGPVPEVDEHTGVHSGFPVAHRLARRHDITVRLAVRHRDSDGSSGGTTAMVTVPPQLLCEIPADPPGSTPRGTPAHLAMVRPAPAAAPPSDDGPTTSDGLPRRQRSAPHDDGPVRAAEPSPQEAAAGRRSFADDLDAFGAGHDDARRAAGGEEGRAPDDR